MEKHVLFGTHEAVLVATQTRSGVGVREKLLLLR